MRLVGWFAVTLVLGLFLAATVAWYGQQWAHRPLSIPEGGVRFEVERGASLAGIAGELTRRGVLERPLYWRLLARLRGMDDRLQAGEYRLQRGLTPMGLLESLVAGDVVRYDVTVPEGWRFRRMLEAVQSHEAVEVTLSGPQELMARLGKPEVAPEGWFYPDTYFFRRGTSDLALLRRSHEHMQQRLQAEWQDREPDLPLETPYEALILASIVEKETAVADERPMIAAVFLERLRRGMRLQSDPTVIYGLGEAYEGDIRSRHLREDQPYNTYTRQGLPPTPIALPSGAAIHAALHPAETDALYFVATGDGRHHFSSSYEEHQRAVAEHQLGGG